MLLFQGQGCARRKDKVNRWTKFLICKHGRAYKPRVNEAYRQRINSTTRKTDCQVRMKVQERPDGTWTLHHLTGRIDHNHPPTNASAYYEHRQLSKTQKEVVVAIYTAGVVTSRIKRSLKAAEPDLEITSRDLYNQTAKIVLEIRQGQPPNEALIRELTEAKEKGELFFEYSLNEEDRILKLFLADMRYVHRQLQSY